MKRFCLCFSITVLLFAVCSGIFLTHTANTLSREMLRLHVIANSDSADDQAVKLLVRNAVCAEMESLTAEATDKAAVMEAVTAHTDTLTAVAKETLVAAGCDLPVTVTVCRESYPTRAYDTFTLPAGVYDSVQVKIGAASGQNWWCVLFPPLCMGVAEVEEELVEVGFTPGQVKLITDSDAVDYTIQFKVVEWVRALQKK